MVSSESFSHYVVVSWDEKFKGYNYENWNDSFDDNDDSDGAKFG